MPIIKIAISKDINRLREDLRRMVDEVFRMPQLSLSGSAGWMPSIDIYEDDRYIYVLADVAGVESEDLELVLEGEFLKMAGTRHPPIATNAKRFFHMEIEYGPFERIIRIPLLVKPDDIEARLENGFLLVRLGKKKVETVNIEVE